jgi:dephospho-CoA kinase
MNEQPAGHGRSPEQRPPVLGLIGAMGSGKSRVAAEFRRHGAQVVSADELGHEALRQPEVIRQVVARWGPGVLDERGEVDRRHVGRIVFADPAELRALERLVFPWIERRSRELIEAARADTACPLVVLDAAVLLEAGWEGQCDRIVYVHAPREVRLQRLARQRGWTPQEVQARERAQLPLTDKVSRADAAVDNAGPDADVARQVEELMGAWGR